MHPRDATAATDVDPDDRSGVNESPHPARLGRGLHHETNPPTPEQIIRKLREAEAELAISQFKARQWAEIERFKAGLRAELREVDILNRKGAMPS